MNHLSSDDFALTWTISPALNNLHLESQYKFTSPELHFILNCLGCEYLVSTEVTKKNNIHYHCYLLFDEDQNYGKLKQRLYKLQKDHSYYLGYFTLKTCYDKINWITYMHKDPYIQEVVDGIKE